VERTIQLIHFSDYDGTEMVAAGDLPGACVEDSFRATQHSKRYAGFEPSMKQVGWLRHGNGLAPINGPTGKGILQTREEGTPRPSCSRWSPSRKSDEEAA